MAGIEAFEKSERYADYISSDRIPFPAKLNLELTTRRSEGCHCPLPLITRPATGIFDLSADTLDYILTSILPYVQALYLGGRGDPCLAEDSLVKTLECATDFGVPVTLETHGLNFSKKITEILWQSSVQNLILNINAPNEDTHRKICGCSLNPIVDFLKKLSEHRQSQSNGMPELHLRMTATRDNIELLPDLMKFANLNQAMSLIIVPMSLANDPDKISAFRYHRDTAEEVIYRSLIESELKGFRLETEPPQLLDALGAVDDIQLFLSGQVPPDPQHDDYIRDCSCIWSHTFIDAEGNILPCQGNFPAVGNITHQSFQNIWYGNQLKAIRRNYVTGFGSSECLACHNLIWRKKRAAKHIVNPVDPNYFLFPGWLDLELEERDFRFTSDRAVVFLNRSKQHLFALAQIRKGPFEGSPGKGKIIINNHEVHPFELQSSQWETLEIPLPDDGKADDLVSLEIIPEKALRPIHLNQETTDYRNLGIKVSGVWLESWEKKVVFAQQLVLLGYDVSPEAWEIDGDVVFRTFWRTLTQAERDIKVLLDFQHEDTDESGRSDSKKGSIRVTSLQSDFLLEHRGLPTSNWQAGTFIAHEYLFPVPDKLKPGHYRIHLGVYPEGDPKKRVKISRSDREHRDNLALLGTVLISQQKR
ncbi:radical SAM protein [bacterium]|nr:radical SAM protein [candidate division CSSED10-310 bacterium]